MLKQILSFFETGFTASDEQRVKAKKEQLEIKELKRANHVKVESSKNKEFCFTQDQLSALELLRSGKNIFITGGAGTGKSYLLKKFIEECEAHDKSILVTAPTGIAAKNINGATLHRTFFLPLGLISPKILEDDPKLEQSKQEKRRKLLKYADILVIDEISMCRGDIFAFIADLLLDQRDNNHEIQLVLCGDFSQLPPVISSNEKKSFESLFPTNPRGWAFLTDQWKLLNIYTIELHQIVRQDNPLFANALNQIRYGNKDGLKYINEHRARSEIENAISICGRNRHAGYINESKLDLISSPSKTYDIKIKGEVKTSDICCDEHLTLKEGARVIVLINDRNGEQYQNGSFGTVTKLFDDKVKILLDDETYADIPLNTWEIYGYEPDPLSEKIKKIVIGTYQQLPLRLGWAVTVHKAQGATYKSVNIETTSFWEVGQMYVALSRCKQIERMYYKNDLSEFSLKSSIEAIRFNSSLK